MHIGEEYRKLQEKNKALLRLYPQLNKKPKVESDSKKAALPRMMHKRPLLKEEKSESIEKPNSIHLRKSSSSNQNLNGTLLR